VTIRSAFVILVADDERVVRHIVSLTLTHAGYRVLVAADGAEALNISRAYDGTIQLLLMDMGMPNLDGGTLAEIIAKERPGIRIIAMTGNSSGTVPPELMPFLLLKPFLPDALLKRIRRELERDLSRTKQIRDRILRRRTWRNRFYFGAGRSE
jgi:CheY-like chemotaxis protein